MIKKSYVYSFLENNFGYVLVIDETGRILHKSRQVTDDLIPSELAEFDSVNKIVTPSSWESCTLAMQHAKEGYQGIAVFQNSRKNASSMPLKVGYLEYQAHDMFVFFGNKLGTFSAQKEWEQHERIKELTCLYNVAEFIETSANVEEFFTLFPKYLAPGMLHPDKVVVYALYDGVEYGEKPASDNYLFVDLKVWGQEKGEIRVGYHDETVQLLPEEQKLLLEIRRILELALERKELKIKLGTMEDEEAAYRNRLLTLTKEIEEQKQELEAQKKKLSMVNTYLSKVNYDWDQAKHRLETVFKAIPDEVMLIDTNRKIVMTNREDIEPGEHCYVSVFGRETPCDDCRLAKILKNKLPVTLTIRDGDRYLQVHSLPVYNKDQDVDGILEFYRDVTIEKTYDQQLQQADKLASIGELVSGIGHEINNPNQFIQGNIKIVKQALDDMLPIIDEYYKTHPDMKIARLKYPFFREHIMMLVDDMAHGSERIKSIVKSLRAFTMKDEGLLDDMVRINPLIEDTTRLVSKEVHKYAEIEFEPGENLPSFKGNTQKIEQVLVNLIVNAGQAIPEGRKGLIRIRTYQEDSRIVIQISDNGKGMTEKTMKQIYDPFFTTKRAKGGTGLGLAIAFRIVEEHNGTISVHSEPDVGTTFTIKIPANPAE